MLVQHGCFLWSIICPSSVFPGHKILPGWLVARLAQVPKEGLGLTPLCSPSTTLLLHELTAEVTSCPVGIPSVCGGDGGFERVRVSSKISTDAYLYAVCLWSSPASPFKFSSTPPLPLPPAAPPHSSFALRAWLPDPPPPRPGSSRHSKSLCSLPSSPLNLHYSLKVWLVSLSAIDQFLHLTPADLVLS